MPTKEANYHGSSLLWTRSPGQDIWRSMRWILQGQANTCEDEGFEVCQSFSAGTIGLTWHAGNGCYFLEQRKYEQVNANIIFPITT